MVDAGGCDGGECGKKDKRVKLGWVELFFFWFAYPSREMPACTAVVM